MTLLHYQFQGQCSPILQLKYEKESEKSDISSYKNTCKREKLECKHASNKRSV